MNRQIAHHLISMLAVIPLVLVLISWLVGEGLDMLNPWSSGWLDLWPIGLSMLLVALVVPLNSALAVVGAMRKKA